MLLSACILQLNSWSNYASIYGGTSEFFSPNLCGSGWTLNASSYFEFLFNVNFCMQTATALLE